MLRIILRINKSKFHEVKILTSFHSACEYVLLIFISAIYIVTTHSYIKTMVIWRKLMSSEYNSPFGSNLFITNLTLRGIYIFHFANVIRRYFNVASSVLHGYVKIANFRYLSDSCPTHIVLYYFGEFCIFDSSSWTTFL